MTRFESIIVSVAAICMAAVHAPVFGQVNVVDGKQQPVVQESKVDARGGKAVKAGRPSKPAPEPAKPKEPTFTVSGGFEATKEKARDSAIRAAVERLHRHMMEQDPPAHRMPTTEMVQRMLVRHPQASEADAQIGKVIEQPIEVGGQKEPMYLVEVAVRVEPEHVRELRSRERSAEALWILAGLGGLVGVIAMFFRIDAWTKGYLTSWLVLGTVGAGALLLGLMWWAK